MFKIVFLLLVLSSTALGTPSLRHRYQENALRILGDEIFRVGRIVGGTATRIEEHPYQVALFYNRMHTCGGSILNQNTVISAAHCTSGRNEENFQVLAGSTNIREGELLEVSRVIQHPSYNDWTAINDIVVIKLVKQIEFDGTKQPISLPSLDLNVVSGHDTVLTGWGTLEWGTSRYPDILQAVTKPALSNQECQEIYDEEEILETHICAGEFGRDACQGDSGGPLVYKGFHVGIVSWGYFCARDYPTVYTRVSEFLEFILEHA